jgi:hypothetical protein
MGIIQVDSRRTCIGRCHCKGTCVFELYVSGG